MNPISESLLMQIAQGLEGYRSYLDIEVNSISEQPELGEIVGSLRSGAIRILKAFFSKAFRFYFSLGAIFQK